MLSLKWDDFLGRSGLEGEVRPSGELLITKIDVEGKPVGKTVPVQFSWKLRNTLRWNYLLGSFGAWFVNAFKRPMRNLFGLVAVRAELRLVLIKNDGTRVDHGVVSKHVVTDVGVAAIVDAFTNAFAIETFNYHGCGTGTTAENANQTDLITPSTTATNPDNIRATGSQTQPSANIYRTTGTLTFDGSAAVTEHGIFSDEDEGEGVLLDRSVFPAVNVVSGESIQFEYSLTFPAGS